MREMWAYADENRPKTLDDFIFTDENQKDTITGWIAEKAIPHLLFAGLRGTGKTSLVYMLKNLLEVEDTDFLKIDGSRDNGVEFIKNTVNAFATKVPTGNFNLIFIDEADRLSRDAQLALRVPIEDYSENCRVILCCNYKNKIFPEVKSRVVEMDFPTLPQDDMLERAITIMRKHNVKANMTTLQHYLNISYPDFRKFLLNLQHNTHAGVVRISDTKQIDEEFAAEFLTCIETNNWENARNLMVNNTNNDWNLIFRLLYENVNICSKFADSRKLWNQAIITIANYLHFHTTTPDPEINMSACLIKLQELN